MEWLANHWWVEAIIVIAAAALVMSMVCWLFDSCEHKDKK